MFGLGLVLLIVVTIVFDKLDPNKAKLEDLDAELKIVPTAEAQLAFEKYHSEISNNSNACIATAGISDVAVLTGNKYEVYENAKKAKIVCYDLSSKIRNLEIPGEITPNRRNLLQTAANKCADSIAALGYEADTLMKFADGPGRPSDLSAVQEAKASVNSLGSPCQQDFDAVATKLGFKLPSASNPGANEAQPDSPSASMPATTAMAAPPPTQPAPASGPVGLDSAGPDAAEQRPIPDSETSPSIFGNDPKNFKPAPGRYYISESAVTCMSPRVLGLARVAYKALRDKNVGGQYNPNLQRIFSSGDCLPPIRAPESGPIIYQLDRVDTIQWSGSIDGVHQIAGTLAVAELRTFAFNQWVTSYAAASDIIPARPG